ncbi:MAG: mycothiol synthase [Acidimicrobiia bacterium]|nr:mycothiol synthase [Acidimicrobiia bacterium]
MGRGDIDAVSALLDVAAAIDGHRALGEHQWLDLVQGGREGFAGLVAWEPGHDHPVAYAQVTRGVADGSWALEFVVDPHHRDRLATIGHEVVGEAIAIVGAEGGGHVHMWVPKPTPAHDAIAEAVGLRRGRELLQLRRPLPVDDAHRYGSEPLPVRAFIPGRDEEAWLEVNNRAFRHHPEQGGWDLETIKNREAQPWFDPDGFLLYEQDGRLAGFCWTKIHRDVAPHLGEIYVIGTDPDFEGRGLGRRLVLAGLDWLAGRGLTVGMLYVDAANEGAVHLYEKLGFTVDHIDRAYVGDVRAKLDIPHRN